MTPFDAWVVGIVVKGFVALWLLVLFVVSIADNIRIFKNPSDKPIKPKKLMNSPEADYNRYEFYRKNNQNKH